MSKLTLGFVPVTADPQPGALSPALQVTIGTGQRCPYCRGALLREDALAACVACLTVAHLACVAEHGGCTTLGCARVHATPAPRVARRRRSRSPGAGWAVAAGLAGGLLGAAAWTARGQLEPRPELPIVCAPLPSTPQPAPVARFTQLDREPWPVEVTLDLADARRGSQDQGVALREAQASSPSIELTAPAAIDGPTLTLTGTIVSDTADVQITVSSGGEETSWEAAAGPFASVVTLPRVGDNAVTVRVRDARGRMSTATRTVRRDTSSVTGSERDALDGR